MKDPHLFQNNPKPYVKHSRTRNEDPADVTLINMNLMLVNQDGRYDQQNYIPLGLLYIASFLEKEGYNVEFIDYQLFSHARRFDAQLFIDAVGKPAPLVGFSCMSNLLPFCVLCARVLKKKYPKCSIVLGGVGPSPVASEISEAFPFISSVVEGEGELPMRDLMEGVVTCLPARKIVGDLNTLPLPAYHLIDFDVYKVAPSIITSRGCPRRCTFCTEPHNFGGKVRYQSIESVIQELELLNSLSGHTLFLFQDDTLPINRPRFKRLLNTFSDLSFPIKWKCFSRVDLMDEELMEEMVDSGCVQIRYGIESGSNKTLKRIKKGFTIQKAYQVAEKSVRHFPSVHASFIWGYPFEEMEEFEETLQWVSKFEAAGVSVLLFECSPLPGSSLYKEFREGLTFSSDNYSFFVVTGHEVVKPDRFDVMPKLDPIYQLIARYPNIFPGFYHWENMNALRKRQRLEQYKTTRRTPVKNEYDI